MKRLLLAIVLVIVNITSFSQENHIQFISTSATLTSLSHTTKKYEITAVAIDTFLLSIKPECLHITNGKTLKTATLTIEKQLLSQSTDSLSGEVAYYYAAKTSKDLPIIVGYFFSSTGNLFAVSIGGEDLDKVMFYTKLTKIN